VVHDARGGNDLVGRIASEVETRDGSTDIQREGPGMERCDRSHELRVVEIDVDAPEICQLGYFPRARSSQYVSISIRLT